MNGFANCLCGEPLTWLMVLKTWLSWFSAPVLLSPNLVSRVRRTSGSAGFLYPCRLLVHKAHIAETERRIEALNDFTIA